MWKQFSESFVREEALVKSHPKNILLVIFVGTAFLIAPAFFGTPEAKAHYGNPIAPASWLLLGIAFTFLYWKLDGKGALAICMTLVDTSCYIAAICLAIVKASPPVSYALSSALGLMLSTQFSKDFSLTPLISIATLGPALVVFTLFGAPVSDSSATANYLIAAMGYLLFFIGCSNTGRQRETQKRNIKLRTALGTADRLARDSMDIALANILLSVGDLLHELRNNQTTVSMNLHYLAQEKLSEDQQDAIHDAEIAHQRAIELVRTSLNDLKKKCKSTNDVFHLNSILRQINDQQEGIMNIDNSCLDIYLIGQPEQIKIILQNLIRNAKDAGATKITVSAQTDSSGSRITLNVVDNGQGFSPKALASAFQPFYSEGKDQGTGLGLYLVKKCVELMGGEVKIANAPAGGAQFEFLLPGKRDISLLADGGLSHDN